MDGEPLPRGLKLIAVVTADFPKACEIAVSYPDQWELINKTWRQTTPLYISALPTQREPPDPKRYHGLSSEVNRDLVNSRLYRLFYPWPLPVNTFSWDPETSGPKKRKRDFKVQLTPIGYAQAWFGGIYGVVIECSIIKVARESNWIEELGVFWQAVRRDMGVKKVFTRANSQAWGEDYRKVLAHLGFAPDRNYPMWWSSGQD